MGYKLYSNINFPSPIECATDNIRESFHHVLNAKTPENLKIDVFQLTNNKNIGKLFSKYELFFPNQANSSSDPSQILILQHPIPISFLPFSPSLSNFALEN